MKLKVLVDPSLSEFMQMLVKQKAVDTARFSNAGYLEAIVAALSDQGRL